MSSTDIRESLSGKLLITVPIIACVTIYLIGVYLIPDDYSDDADYILPLLLIILTLLVNVLFTSIAMLFDISKAPTPTGLFKRFLWFLSSLCFWFITYPIYFFHRKKYGLKMRLGLSIFISMILLICFFVNFDSAYNTYRYAKAMKSTNEQIERTMKYIDEQKKLARDALEATEALQEALDKIRAKREAGDM